MPSAFTLKMVVEAKAGFAAERDREKKTPPSESVVMPDIVAAFPRVGPAVGFAVRRSAPVVASNMSMRKLVAKSRGTAITLVGAAVTRPQNA
jgi:hypothetical protein